jgi:DnaJ-class molecular chaperone
MGWFSSHDEPAEKRKDCPACDGHGKIVEYNRDRFGHVTIERTKCRKCKGSGLK